jgi:hypothetical protein
MAHQLYPTDPAPAGTFDVRWHHFHPQLLLEQQQRASYLSPEADVALQVIYVQHDDD